jgi:hypothetical protein
LFREVMPSVWRPGRRLNRAKNGQAGWDKIRLQG